MVVVVANTEVDLSIYNAHILTMNNKLQSYNRGYLLVKDARIFDIGSMDDFHTKYGNKLEVKEEINAKGDLVLPGFVNAHGHFAMTLFRGIADDIPLNEWLREFIWPIEAKLTPEDCYVGSQLAAIEMIQGGTTTACDMYFNEDKTLDALEEIGFRGVLGHGMLDLFDAEKREKEFIDTKQFIEYVNQHGKICSVIISPHAPNTCSDELLINAKKLADENNLPMQIHLAETKNEVDEFNKNKKCSPVQYLDQLNFLTSNLVAAHCVWLSSEDAKVLVKHKVNIAHNPSSNLKLGSGVFNYDLLSSLNLNISLGTDGAASNNNLSMIEEIRLAAFLHKGTNTNPKILPASEAIKMATINGAQALGLKKEVGSLEKGKKADIIIIDTKTPNVWPPHNPYAMITYSAHDTNVRTTIINGKIVMKDRHLAITNYKEIITNAKDSIINLIDKIDLKQIQKKMKYLQ
ncbi:MAG: amidohydrolase [Asgard group archaeon]|nr:amidohydrolase [Asgard group archaeon]